MFSVFVVAGFLFLTLTGACATYVLGLCHGEGMASRRAWGKIERLQIRLSNVLSANKAMQATLEDLAIYHNRDAVDSYLDFCWRLK